MGVEDLSDSSVDLKVTAEVHESNIYNARRILNRELKLALDAGGIEIPFPQIVVWQGHKEGSPEECPGGPSDNRIMHGRLQGSSAERKSSETFSFALSAGCRYSEAVRFPRGLRLPAVRRPVPLLLCRQSKTEGVRFLDKERSRWYHRPETRAGKAGAEADHGP